MAQDIGITGYGAYIPRMRLARSAIASAHAWMAPSLRALGNGTRAFCNWDEDAITMAVEAARDALRPGERDSVRHIAVASTTLPYADLQPSAIVAGALGLSAPLASSDLGFTQRAGTSGLLAALGRSEAGLFVASDALSARPASPQEMTFGAGAAAFLTGSEDIIARLVGSASVSANFVDHFRAAGAQYDYNWEERWIRDEGHAKLIPEAVSLALRSASMTIQDIDYFVFGSALRNAAGQLAKRLGFKGAIADELGSDCGYSGAAHSLLMLTSVLERSKPGARILVVSFGQGADAFILETTAAIANRRPVRGVAASLANGLETDAYLRMLSFAGGMEPEWGMRAERSAKTALTEQFRSAPQMEAFQAGVCGACGTVQFPQLQYCVNCHAPDTGFTPLPLAGEIGTVLTSTADWLSYYPSPPLYVGFVQFDNGARILMEMVDAGPEGFETGQRVSMAFRIKERDRQRGYNRYFWKAAPVPVVAEEG